MFRASRFWGRCRPRFNRSRYFPAALPSPAVGPMPQGRCWITWHRPRPWPSNSGMAWKRCDQLGGFTAIGFFGQFPASASYNITYAPSVSDYSRYLPRRSRPLTIVAAVYAGASSSAIWLIVVGAWLATRLGASDGLVALYVAGNAVFPGFGALLSLLSVVALPATMGLNAYSGMLTVLTAHNSLFATLPRARLRLPTIIVLALLFAVLTIMLYLLVPRTSINLIDYF